MIKELYDRLKVEIEKEKGISVGRLTLTDDNGIVSIRVIPKITEISINFTDAGNPVPEEDDEVVTTPTDEGDGIIIEWGTTGDAFVLAFNVNNYNVYRSKDGGAYEKVATTSEKTYIDRPLESGTYSYYVVAVNDKGEEGVPSAKSTITI